MLAYDSWSPDEANPSFDRIDIWISDADGANARQVTTCESPCLQRSWAAWSPDGTKLAMIRYDLTPDQTWGPSALEILDLASGDIRVVAETEDGLTSYYTPRWSPDGRRIVFGLETYADASQSTLVTSALAVTSVVGSDAELTILTPPDLEARFPDWHPTDDRIVFQARRPESGASTTDLYVIGADAVEPHQPHGLRWARTVEPRCPPGRLTVCASGSARSREGHRRPPHPWQRTDRTGWS